MRLANLQSVSWAPMLALLWGCASSPDDLRDTGVPALTESEALGRISEVLELATEGYACRTGYHHSNFDDDRTVRIGIDAGVSSWGDPPPEVGASVEVPIGEDDGLVLLVEGTCLSTPGCTDVIISSCSQSIERRWLGTAGTMFLEHTTDGVVGELRNLELTEVNRRHKPRPNGATVSVGLVELVERAYWEE